MDQEKEVTSKKAVIILTVSVIFFITIIQLSYPFLSILLWVSYAF